MAEVNSLSLSNLEGVTVPSISQETTQQVTNDLSLSNLEGVEVVPTTVVNNELSLSNLDGVESTTITPKINTTKISSLYTGEKTDGVDRSFIVDGEPTTAEKIAYGLDKQSMFFGNVFRVAKAGLQAAFDPDKEFKEVALDNAANEQADLWNRHEKFRGGKFDEDIEVLAAEMATFLLDPYYIFMYMTPWGRAISMRQQGLKPIAKFAGFSAGTVSLDKLFDNLATTGEVNPKSVAEAGTFAAVLGPASMKAFQIIGKLLPKADKSKIAQVVQVIEGKTQAQLGVNKAEWNALQKIAGDKEFLKLNKQLSTTENASRTLIKNQAKEQDEFYKSVLKIDKDIAKLKADKKLIKSDVVGLIDKKKATQSISDKILKIQKAERAREKAFDKAQTELWKKNSLISKKVIDDTAKRDVLFLEKLWKEKSLTEKTAQIVLSASIRPLMGAATAYGFGKLWGPDDANIGNWMLVGATLGGISKGVQASKVLPGASKSRIQNFLYQDATKYAFQKVRELTSTTTSTKLASIGGSTEKIGLQLLEGIDSSFAKSSVTQRADNLLRQWQLRTANVNRPYSLDEQAAALSVIRGSKQKVFKFGGKDVTNRVKTLAGKLEKELQDFKKLREEAGIFSLNEKTGKLMEIKNYFPRVYDWAKIKEDPKKFEKVIIGIFKSLGKNDEQAKKSAAAFSKSLLNQDDTIINQLDIDNYVQGITKKIGVLKKNPLSEHITKARILEGPYAKVEKVLEDGGYLVNNANDVLFNLYNRSVKSIAFAEKFGNKGQMLKPYIDSIMKKYENAVGKQLGITQENWKAKALNEIRLITNTIDGYFGRYGTKQMGVSKSIAGTLATVSNLNMLDRVTIASLGDLVQPFSNSNNLLSFWKGALRTGFTQSRETGVAKNMNLNLSNEIRGWLQKTGSKIDKKSTARNVMGEEAVLKFDDATQAANVMGKMGPLRKVNEWGFKIMGLQWLTGLARRYAYNVGAVDAYTSANKLARFVNAGGKLDSSKGLRLVKDLNKYSISAEDGLRLGAFNTFDDAVANKAVNKVLNQSGILAANRDALIPQVQNRLLFAQSRNPWVRLMGQFTSWAMAKSAQTNKMLQRIENGEARQMVKLLAALPVYGGIQMLRELAKHGEVITDPAYDEEKWWSEALRLSGMSGILPELTVGRLTGPGSQMPWFIPFPAASVATDAGKIVQDTLVGDTDKAWKRFLEKIVPLPTYRKWIMELFSGVEVTKKYGGSSNVDSSDNTIKPKKFSHGGIVIKRKKFNQGDLALSNLQGTVVIKKNNETLTNNDKYIVGDNLNNDLNFNEEKVIENKTPIKVEKNKPNELSKDITINKKNIIPEKKPAYGDDEFINYIKKVENDPLRLGLTKKVIHKSAEGGNDTVAYGHKLTNKEKETGMVYGYDINNLTKEQQNDILIRDLQKADKQLIKVYGDAYLKLDKRKKQMLIDFQFNMGSGGVEKFKNFRDGLFNNDESQMEKEYERGYTDENNNFIKLDGRNNQFYNFFFKQKFNIGGVVSKLVSKALVNRGKTAITSTKGTYTKANKIFDDLKKEKIHDFGSGKGVGSNEFKNKIVTSHEPYVSTEAIVKAKGKIPNYKTADEVILNDGIKSKDGIVNLNVLNVIESFPDRNKVVEQIGKLLADDGVAIITTRSAKDVINQAKKSKNATKYLDGWLFGKGNSKTFQKGFEQKELEDYIKIILGKGFKVEKIPSKYDIKTTGILIKKLKEELV